MRIHPPACSPLSTHLFANHIAAYDEKKTMKQRSESSGQPKKQSLGYTFKAELHTMYLPTYILLIILNIFSWRHFLGTGNMAAMN